MATKLLSALSTAQRAVVQKELSVRVDLALDVFAGKQAAVDRSLEGVFLAELLRAACAGLNFALEEAGRGPSGGAAEAPAPARGPMGPPPEVAPVHEPRRVERPVQAPTGPPAAKRTRLLVDLNEPPRFAERMLGRFGAKHVGQGLYWLDVPLDGLGDMVAWCRDNRVRVAQSAEHELAKLLPSAVRAAVFPKAPGSP